MSLEDEIASALRMATGTTDVGLAGAVSPSGLVSADEEESRQYLMATTGAMLAALLRIARAIDETRAELGLGELT